MHGSQLHDFNNVYEELRLKKKKLNALHEVPWVR